MRGLLKLAVVCLIATCALLGSSSCGNHRSSALAPYVSGDAPLETPPDLQAGLPPLSALRAASVTQDFVRDGADTLQRSANAVDAGTALNLNSGAEELAWAVWGWGAAGDDLLSLAFAVDVPVGQQIYFALADYQAQRWEVYGPLTDDEQFVLDDTRHKSGSGSVYCAALACGGAAPTCQSVTLTVDTAANEPPVAVLGAWPMTGKLPLRVWFSAFESSDDRDAIEDYEWDLDGDGNFNEPGGEEDARGRIGPDYVYTEEGEFSATVRVTDDGGLTDTAAVPITVGPPNVPPVADLQADPTEGATPLNVTLDGTATYDPDGTDFDIHWDFDDDGLYNEPGLEEEKENFWLIGYAFNSAGVFDIGLRVTDPEGEADFAYVTVSVTGNQAPTADLQADVTQGDPPFNVQFDATGSSDPDGSIAGYEWDFDGDGYFSEAGPEQDAQGSGTPLAAYDAAGVYAASVRVTDDVGGTDTAELTVTAHGWVITTLARDGFYSSSSLALVDGNPAVSYIAQGEGGCTLVYNFSATPFGTRDADWQPHGLTTTAQLWSTSLKVVGGNPAIAYSLGAPDDDLGYIRSSTPRGELPGEWQALLVDSAGETGKYPSLAVVDGRPAIAYSSGSPGGEVELRYALSSSATGGAAGDWDCISLLPAAGEMWISLAQAGGKPAIAYYEDGDAVLKYAYASTADGASAADWHSITIDSSALGTGQWCSLALVAGVPAIAYVGWIDDNMVLRYAVSSSAQGANPGDWTALTVDASPWSGRFAALAEIGGQPAIAYQDDYLGVLRFGLSSTPAGGDPADWSCATVDDSGYCGDESALAVINGCPAISYNYYGDFGLSELRYAIYLQ